MSCTCLNQMSDEELLAAYRCSGSPQFFEALLRRYEPALRDYLLRFLGDAELAQQAILATFAQVRLNRFPFDGQHRVRPWLYTVATHQALKIQHSDSGPIAFAQSHPATVGLIFARG